MFIKNFASQMLNPTLSHLTHHGSAFQTLHSKQNHFFFVLCTGTFSVQYNFCNRKCKTCNKYHLITDVQAKWLNLKHSKPYYLCNDKNIKTVLHH